MSEPIPLVQVGSSTSRHGTRPLTSASLEAFPLSLDGKENASEIHPIWKRNLYSLMENPTSSQAAFMIHIFTTAIIILSAIVTVLETVPAFHSIPASTWFGLETSLVALFTVEYLLRCVAHSNNLRSFFVWVTSFFGIIDLLGILPYYIEIAMQQDTAVLFRFSILRTFRLLRVFRPFRHNNTILLTIEVMILSFRRSQHALLALAFFVIMVLIIFSTLLYFIERGTWDESLGIFMNSDGDPSQFSSIPAAAWFVLVTITTVGYGEITPRSILGRLVTLPLLVFGLLLIALPTFVLGREFSIAWELLKDQEVLPEDGTLATPLTSPDLRRHGTRRSSFLTERRPRNISDLYSIATSSERQAEREQLDLSSQVAELRSTIEMQGEMLKKLVGALEGKGKDRMAGSSRHQNGEVWS